MRHTLSVPPVCWAVGTLLAAAPLAAQPAPEDEAAGLRKTLAELQTTVAELGAEVHGKQTFDERRVADVAVCAKAVEWILRHEEFYKPQYAKQARTVLDLGLRRAEQLRAGSPQWLSGPGAAALGYVSRVDGSVQPYVLTLPEGVSPADPRRWPLHVVLHGRADEMNEVNFIARHDGRPAAEGQDWIQLDVFGRGNNAYRWAGETDVFEALDDVKRRLRIDERRITLRGFSMGGAGAWHLGLHHPGLWSSVGAGAGFVDTRKYQNIKDPLPPHQEQTLAIYDAERYALNAFNVPVVTYGGEQDKQLAASTTMVEAARAVDVEIKFILGKGVGHKFTPEAEAEFMAFHREKSARGRTPFPGAQAIRFVTYTPKYSRCEWLTVEELEQVYEPATVEAEIDRGGTLHVTTKNVAVLQISRDVATDVRLDGKPFPLSDAADGLLPGVYYEQGRRGWNLMTYDQSRRYSGNPQAYKRHNLQGPIDDAFMEPFVCVLPTGKPWSEEHAAWSDWTYRRFAREWDKWMRGEVRTVKDTEITDDITADANLILFGDPGSNKIIADVLERLPVEWTEGGFEFRGKSYDANTHGLALIHPNPLNPRRYVVINSGHTFHEPQFKASNAQLYPRLGDIAVQRFGKSGDGYQETVEWAAIFNTGWKLPEE